MIDIKINKDNDDVMYSNESILKGILHNTYFDGGTGWFIGNGIRSEVVRALGFSDHPTEKECRSKMVSFTLEAYPSHRFTLHKDLVNEVQNIYKELKRLGVQLNQYQGHYFYRTINNPNMKKNTPILSMHSFGCAIDLNYNLNPFAKNSGPLTSGDDTIHGIMRTMNSPIVRTFAKYGWGWGGRYGDYMHFSKANGC